MNMCRVLFSLQIHSDHHYPVQTVNVMTDHCHNEQTTLTTNILSNQIKLAN